MPGPNYKKDLEPVNKRFLFAMNIIIADGKLAGGKVDSPASFARSIGMKSANYLYQLSDPKKYNRYVTVKMIMELHRVHKIEYKWLLDNKGEMRVNKR